MIDVDDEAQTFVREALRRMTDEQLQAFDERLHDLMCEYDPELATVEDHGMRILRMASLIGSGRAAPETVALFFLVGLRVGDEQEHREDTVWNARIEVEANGHEVYIDSDSVMGSRDGRPWVVWCHCAGDGLRWGDEPIRYYATEAAARAAGEQHVAETGGRFRT